MVTEPNLDKNDGTEPKARKKEKKKKTERRAEKEKAALPASARRAAQSAVVTAAEVRKRPREETLSAKAPKLPEPPEHSPAADASEAAAADQPKPSLEEAEAAAGRTMHKDSREAAEAAITQGRRVYVSNLPFSTSDEWVRTSFSAVESIHWIAAKGSGFRGSGFLTFASAEAATEAGLLRLRPLAASCVFVRNLPAEQWSLEAVRRIFEACGPPAAIRLPKKGKAAIRFKTAAAAAAAAARDGEEIGGRKVALNPVRVLLTSALADPEAEAEEARRRARGGAAAAARQEQLPAPPTLGEPGYRSSHARRGGPRERAHSRQRRPRRTAEDPAAESQGH
ncbi:hypothetical protein EMIHUDRAFT_120096 [Emiliania huxleyi CCMP1516]|uniref:RRM domain-containing protein n=2 Tax=Emiliania huxleyi TaxID=2903 RepID=A0A0D3IMN0_EMIH1|nr:hypothetical protein EMIHUDRAFT_120096 [Emiliania huxleyi CCMP1516]EOD12515.1 hypothetical protein EMIHUDRAFT_120096 [Emiliania huxleyi CCMP1516]|eukprot:XP_005764944.1 hypothetical protein EMIHUDRAFT_120096 [Emiliania huxleyi CCMP1516]